MPSVQPAQLTKMDPSKSEHVCCCGCLFDSRVPGMPQPMQPALMTYGKAFRIPRMCFGFLLAFVSNQKGYQLQTDRPILDRFIELFRSIELDAATFHHLRKITPSRCAQWHCLDFCAPCVINIWNRARLRFHLTMLSIFEN